MSRGIITRLGTIRLRHAVLIFAAVGLVTFSSGLFGPFQNDDTPQIVDNKVVHSLGNLPQFFAGSTFYDGEGLSGVYYRPLMTTVYALIYAVFGPQPAAFHAVQLGLHITVACLVFLVLGRFLKRPAAFVLALIFLVHPLNSQVVFSIPTMQDALYAVFGLWALWRLTAQREGRGYWDVAGLLLLSLLSKEAGVLFVLISLIYVWLYRRGELRKFALTLAAPAVLYLFMKISAVGFLPSQHAGPINDLTLGERLLTAPSVLVFYIAQFVWPAQLALTRYWTHTSWSIDGVLMPLLVDLALIGLLVWGFLVVRQRLKRPQATAYGFFALWFAVGMAPYLQSLPGLDMTACETWFYVPMIGLLGMIGVTLYLVPWKRLARPVVVVLFIGLVLVIGGLAGRSMVRGFDYTSQYNLARVDLVAEADNYAALNNVAQHYLQQEDYSKAIEYARASVARFPVSSNYINLGVGLQQTGQYAQAFDAYDKALTYGNASIIYENLALLHIVASKPAVAAEFFSRALHEYPTNFKLWLYDAVFEGAAGNRTAAKAAVVHAAKYGDVPAAMYANIMNGTPFIVPILGTQVLVR